MIGTGLIDLLTWVFGLFIPGVPHWSCHYLTLVYPTGHIILPRCTWLPGMVSWANFDYKWRLLPTELELTKGELTLSHLLQEHFEIFELCRTALVNFVLQDSVGEHQV